MYRKKHFLFKNHQLLQITKKFHVIFVRKYLKEKIMFHIGLKPGHIGFV